MFSTRRTAPPRIGCRMSPGRIAGTATARERWLVAGPPAGARASAASSRGAVASGRGASFTMTVTGDGSGSGGRPSGLVEVGAPAGLDGRTVLPVLLEQVEGERVVRPEVGDEGLQERIGLGCAHIPEV